MAPYADSPAFMAKAATPTSARSETSRAPRCCPTHSSQRQGGGSPDVAAPNRPLLTIPDALLIRSHCRELQLRGGAALRMHGPIWGSVIRIQERRQDEGGDGIGEPAVLEE